MTGEDKSGRGEEQLMFFRLNKGWWRRCYGVGMYDPHHDEAADGKTRMDYEGLLSSHIQPKSGKYDRSTFHSADE